MGTPPARCPACGSREVRVTLPSSAGTYCACSDCGHFWHEDAPARPADTEQGRGRRRRKTDPPIPPE